MARQARILYYDIETTNLSWLVNSYSPKLYSNYLSHKDLVRDQTILSVAWNWFHEGDRVHCVSIKPSDPFNDKGVVSHFHSIMQQADIVIGHNSDNFDFKKLNGKFIKYRLDPIFFEPRHNIDTLKLARKYIGTPYKNLEYLCKEYELGSQKEDPPNWKLVMEGDEDEIRKMRQYNKSDILAGKELYLLFRPYHKHHPDVAAIQDLRDVAGVKILACKHCGDPNNLIQNGNYYNRARTKKKKRYQCNSCKGQTYDYYYRLVTDD